MGSLVSEFFIGFWPIVHFMACVFGWLAGLLLCSLPFLLLVALLSRMTAVSTKPWIAPIDEPKFTKLKK